jgi:hypothetical protein
MGNRVRTRLKIFVARFFTGIVIGLTLGTLSMLIPLLLVGIHPLDRWGILVSCEVIGLIAGAVIGLVWGTGAALLTTIKPPPSNSDSPGSTKLA